MSITGQSGIEGSVLTEGDHPCSPVRAPGPAASGPGRAERAAAARLRIGGFVPFTATDYPDRLAAVIFCQGCPWRCGYCHNPHLLPSRSESPHAWARIAAFLQTRRGLLDAVVFSGGEPTLQDALPAAMDAVREMGFKVGLHTAGIYPRKLASVLPLVDWVGMDVKAPFDSYERVTGVVKSGCAARESAKLVIASGVAHEFRTTVDRSVIRGEELDVLADALPRMGARRYVLQTCRSRGSHGTAPGVF